MRPSTVPLHPRLLLVGLFVLASPFASTEADAGPTIVATLGLPGYAHELAVSGDFVYVAAGPAGVQVVSIADPANPSIVGQYSALNDARDVAVDGDRLLVADNQGPEAAVLLDLSDPTNPGYIKGIPVSLDARRVQLRGNRAMLAAGVDGWVMLDLFDDPATIGLITGRDTPGEVEDAQLKQFLVYAADGPLGLKVFDVTNLPTPSTIWDSPVPGHARSLEMSGRTAFLAAEGGGILRFRPPYTQAIDPDTRLLLGEARDVEAASGTMNAVDSAFALWGVDTSDFLAPFSERSFVRLPVRPQALARSGLYQILACGDDGLVVVQVEEASSPYILTSFGPSTSYPDAASDGSLFFLANGGSFTVEIWEALNGSVPSQVISLAMPAPVAALCFHDGMLYAGLTNSQIVHNRVSPGESITAPVIFSDPGIDAIHELVAFGDYLYVFLDGGNIRRFQIVPGQPILALGTTVGSGDVLDARMSGTAIVLVDASSLRILDLADPNSPSARGVLGLGAPSCVDVDGDYAFVGTATGVSVVSIQDLDSPGGVGSLPLGVPVYDLTVEGNLLYCSSLNGLQVVDVSNPGSPVLQSSYFLYGGPCEVEYVGGQVFYSMDNGGTHVFQVAYPLAGDWGPHIVEAKDVPGDQGGHITLNWFASPYDAFSQGAAIVDYTVWRALDAVAAEALGIDLREIANEPGLRVTTKEGEEYFWELVDTIPAYGRDTYSSTVETLADETPLFSGLHYFQLIAHTDDPQVRYESNVVSGTSTDDLSPIPPQGAVATAHYGPAYLSLSWMENPESDFLAYRVYRGEDPDFVPGPGELLGETTDTSFVDTEWVPGSADFYKIIAVDVHRNQSEATALSALEAVSAPETPRVHAGFLSVHPNPFNPRTTIAFGLPRTGPVELVIYDAGGRRVATLVDGELTSGEHRVRWYGTDGAGTRVASGVYLLRLRTDGFVATKRVALLK